MIMETIIAIIFWTYIYNTNKIIKNEKIILLSFLVLYYFILNKIISFSDINSMMYLYENKNLFYIIYFLKISFINIIYIVLFEYIINKNNNKKYLKIVFYSFLIILFIIKYGYLF